MKTAENGTAGEENGVGYDGIDSDPEVDDESEYSDTEDDGICNPLPSSCFESPPVNDSVTAEPDKNNANTPVQKKAEHRQTTKKPQKRNLKKATDSKIDSYFQAKKPKLSVLNKTRCGRKSRAPKRFDDED